MTRKQKAGGKPPAFSVSRDAVAVALDGFCSIPALIDAVTVKVALVAQLRENEATMPTRAAKKKRLRDVARAARIIKSATLDWDLTILLDNAAPGSMSPLLPRSPAPGHPELAQTMADLSDRADRAAKFLDGIEGRGKMRDSLDAGRPHVLLDPRLLCAVLAIEVWRVAKGQEPTCDNRKAQSLCASLWIAAGGTETDAASDGRWRRWLDGARPPTGLTRSLADLTRADLTHALQNPRDFPEVP